MNDFSTNHFPFLPHQYIFVYTMEVDLLETIYQLADTGSKSRQSSVNMLSLAGGGGKTSLLYRIAAEWGKQHTHSRCISTTTTMMYAPESITAERPIPFSSCVTYRDWMQHKAEPLELFGTTPFIYERDHHTLNKVHGISPSTVDTFIQDPSVSLIISESDGAHRLPIKAPNAHEPLHPSKTSIVIGVIGLSSYQKPFTSDTVHRFDLFRQITDKEPETTIDSDVYIDLIRHPDGLFKSTPSDAVRIVFLNQADLLNPKELTGILDSLANGSLPIDAVIMGSLRPQVTIFESFTYHKGTAR